MLKTIFAVDPGVVSGWAVMTVEANPSHIGCGQRRFNKGDSADIEEIMRNCPIQLREKYDIADIVVIEDQYLDRGWKRNINSLIKLARSAGRWEESASFGGFDYEYIHPNTWIYSELGKGLRRDQIAVLAKQKCETLYRLKGLSEHEYCAILIGRYVAIREWRKGLGK